MAAKERNEHKGNLTHAITSPAPVRYVIELQGGNADKLGVKVGGILKIQQHVNRKFLSDNQRPIQG